MSEFKVDSPPVSVGNLPNPHNVASSVANNASSANERPPLAPGLEVNPQWAGWFPEAETIYGTNENRSFLSNIKLNREYAVEHERMNLAFRLDETYQKRAKEYEERIRGIDPTGPLPEPPVENRYAHWIKGFGQNADEASSNIALTQGRIEHIYDRMIDAGVLSRIRANSNIQRDFEELTTDAEGDTTIATWLKANDFLKSDDEVRLFNRHANNPYSSYWGLSLYERLYKRYEDESPENIWKPSNLPMEILRGRTLNPNNPKDVRDWERFKKWKSTQQGQGFIRNFLMGMSHLGTSFQASFKHGLRGLRYTEFDWSDEWAIASGENAELKKQFVDTFDKWVKDPRSSGDWELEAFAGYDVNSRHAGFDFPDPVEVKPIKEGTQELLNLYRQLEKKGAFKRDHWGAASFLAALDGIVQGTLAISALGASTDPDSIVFNLGAKAVQRYQEISDSPMEKDIPSAMKKLIGATRTQEDLTRAEMTYFAASVHGQNFLMESAQRGLLFHGDWYDSKVGYNTSMWADVFVLAGVAAKGLKALKGATAQRAILGGVEADVRGLNAVKANVEYVTRKGVEFTGDTKTLIDMAVDELSRQSGREVKVVEAVDALLRGEELYVDALNKNSRRALSDSEKASLRQSIIEQANTVFQVRKELAKIHKVGRAWSEGISTQSKDILEKVRQRLHEVEPKLGWDKANAYEVYKRLRQSSDFVLAENSSIKITQQELALLNREVGDVWRGIDVTGKAGFRSADSLGMNYFDPMLYGNRAARGIAYIFEKIFKGAGRVSEFATGALSRHAFSPGEAQTVLRNVTTPTHEIASTRIGSSSTSALEKTSQLNKWIALGRVMGNLENSFKVFGEYLDAMRKNPVDAATTVNGLKVGWQSRLNEIERTLYNNKTGGTRLTKAQITVLEEEAKKLTQHIEHISKWDVASRYGIIDAMNGVGSFGGSLVVGEGMMWMNDTDLLGMPSGFVSTMRGGHIVGHSVLSNFDPAFKMKERSNIAMYALSQRIPHLEPAQGAMLLELLTKLHQRKEESYKAKGSGFLAMSIRDRADIEFAQGLAILERLYSINGDVVLTKGTGLIDAAVHVVSSSSLRSQPEVREELLTKLIDTAHKLGYTGEEARSYAIQLLNNHEDSVVAQHRLGDIDTQIAELEGKKHTHAKSMKRLDELKATLQQYVAEAGLNPDRVFVEQRVSQGQGPMGSNINVDYDVKTGKVIIDGKEVVIPDIGGANKKIVNKIAAVISEWKELHAKIDTINNDVVNINSTIASLVKEKETLTQIPTTPGFDRSVISAEDGSFILNRKGLTIWDQKVKALDGSETNRAKVFLDIESFMERARFVEEIDPKTGKPSRRMVDAGGYAVALEEYAHALFFVEGMRDTRTQMLQDILGGWMYDEEGILVNKLPDKNGNLIDAPPAITGDVNRNIELLRRYAESYSESLPEFAKAEFLAKFDFGVKKWEANHLDTRHLQMVLNELFGSMYVQRHMQGNPFVHKSSIGDSQSYHGSLNTASVITSEPSAMTRWSKILFGQTTIADILMQDRYDLAAIEPNTPQAAAAEKLASGALNMLRYFAPGGHIESFTKNNIAQRLRQLGLIRNNNNSSDPFAAWSQTEMFANNEWRDMPIEARNWVDGAIRHTRNLAGDSIKFDDEVGISRIIENANSDDPAEVSYRINWAYATGRSHWLSSKNDPIRLSTPGQAQQTRRFVADIDKLFYLEGQVIRDLVGMVLREDPNGVDFGLSIRKSGNSHALVGMPNPEQAERVYNWIKEQSKNRASENGLFKMSDNTMDVIKQLLFSLSNSTSHREAASTGYNRVFDAEYTPIRTGVGPGTTATVKATGPRDMTFTPLMLIVKDTTLDAEGRPIAKGTNKKGETAYLSRPMLYVLAYDNRAGAERITRAWQGRLVDSTGSRYKWNNTEMVALFGNLRNFSNAVEAVLLNAATAKYGSTADSLPESKSWQVLMEYSGNDVRKAYKMAGIIHRTIGTWDNKYFEVAVAERDLARAKSAESIARLEQQIEEGKESPGWDPDERQEMLAGTVESKTKVYGRGPMGDTIAPFMLLRPDRFNGPIVQRTSVYDKGNIGLTFPMTGASYGVLQVAFANQGDWARLPGVELAQIKKNYTWGSSVLSAAWNHPSGYVVWKVNNRKGGRFDKEAEYRIIAPDGSLVQKPVGMKSVSSFKTFEEATTYVSSHSQRNPQHNIPIVGNETERAMHAAGWNPKGTRFAVNARAEFASADGKYVISRNQNGHWDLYHNDTGIMLMPDIGIYSQEKDAKGRMMIDPKAVLAVVRQAEDLNLVESALDVDWVRKNARGVPGKSAPAGKESGVSEVEIARQVGLFNEWVRKPTVVKRDDNPVIAMSQRGGAPVQRKFSQNHFYWEWKRALGRATSPLFAVMAAERLVAELGEAVVEADKTGVATKKWADAFDKRLNDEGAFAVWLDERDFTTQHADLQTEANRVSAEKLRKDLAHKSTPPKKPNEPAKPIRAAYDTNENYEAAIADWEAQIKQYNEQLLDFEAFENGKSHREMQQEWQRLRNLHIAHYRRLMEQDSKTVSSWWVAESGDLSPDSAANFAATQSLQGANNAARQAGQAAVVDSWVSKSGYLIHQMMYDEPKIGPGIKFEFSTGTRNVPTKRNIAFVIYSAEGQLVGKYDTWEEARRAGYLHKFGGGIHNLLDLSKELPSIPVKAGKTKEEVVKSAIERYAK